VLLIKILILVIISCTNSDAIASSERTALFNQMGYGSKWSTCLLVYTTLTTIIQRKKSIW
jgi:hypothetical protein